MLRFDGRTAIVTGAGRGLGRAHALLLAERGAAVVVNDPGAELDGSGGRVSAAEEVADEIRRRGGRAIVNTDTVATPEGGANMVSAAIEHFGSLEIVINNAGILRDKAFHNMTPQLLEAVIDVHLKGAFFVTQPAWRHMRDRGYGRIVNTSSGSGILGNFGQANYGAAKAGLLGLTRVLALEGARHGIRVNAIAPTALTRMTETAIAPDVAAAFDPAAVAAVVAWLSHEDCDRTGRIFSVGGGRVAEFFIGLTRGYRAERLTPEMVGEHIADVCRHEDFTVPGSAADEIGQLMEIIRNG